MAGIQVGGIVSGLDTNSLIDKMTQQAQIPVNRMKGELSYNNLEKEIFNDFNSKLGDLKSDMLTLRLESTFKSKNVTSSNEGLVSASASLTAKPGKHTITVEQAAKNSRANSSFTQLRLSQAGANVAKITGFPKSSLEGEHTVMLSTSGSDKKAVDVFTVEGVGNISKQTGATLTNVDSTGDLTSDIAGDFTITYKDKTGAAQTLTVNGTFGSTGDDINKAAANIEKEINLRLNAAMGTNNVSYVAIGSELDNANNWTLSMYETSMDDYDINIGGTDAGGLRDELGFAESYSPSTSTVSGVVKTYVENGNYTALSLKITASEGGIVGSIGVNDTSGLQDGTFKYYQSATLSGKTESCSMVNTTEKPSTGSGLATGISGLQNAGFAQSVTSDSNGFFTINDVKIEIKDFSKITVNDLLAKINSSGAGVTASYDSASDSFQLKANDPGAKKISLGSIADTSNMLQVMNLDSLSRPTTSLGSSQTGIDTSKNLANAGFVVPPLSGTFTINGVMLYVDSQKDSMTDIMNKVNKSGAGVTMSYDTASDKVVLQSDTIKPITIGSTLDSSNIMRSFNLVEDPKIPNIVGEEGQRAIFNVDGNKYIRESNTVDDVITGVTFDINGASINPVSINVAVDTDKGVEAIARLIAHYNTIMEKLDVPARDKKEENKYTDYLTDKDKKSKSEDDIKKYMEKYELYNGYQIIRKSSEFRNLDSVMRKNFFAERTGITGSINSMADLGIDVAGDRDIDVTKLGYLVKKSTDYEEIMKELKDNDTFMKNLRENSHDIYKFFGNTSDQYEKDKATLTDKDKKNDVTINSLNYPDLGWARFYDQMLIERYTGDSGTIGRKIGANGSLAKEITRLTERIKGQQDRVQNQLERYWAQFTAMEKSIAQSQAMAADFNKAGSK